MPDFASIDLTDIDELEATLSGIPAVIAPEARKVLTRGALNIKRDWAKAWTGHKTFPALPRSISYDDRRPSGESDGLEVEIGPDKERRAGALGNLIEFGSRNNAPLPGGQPALDAEAPRFEAALADVAESVTLGRL